MGGLYLADVHGIRTLGSLGVFSLILAGYLLLFYYFIMEPFSIHLRNLNSISELGMLPFLSGSFRIQQRRARSRDAGTPSALAISSALAILSLGSLGASHASRLQQTAAVQHQQDVIILQSTSAARYQVAGVHRDVEVVPDTRRPSPF
jgi:hypothetical protein